jgi:putative peptidoglycan lipid II flippase
LAEAVIDSDQRRTTSNRGRTTGIVSILTVAVAGVGYLREAALASRFGLSPSMDAYFAATFVPTLVYMILVAGTLSPIFIPILVEHIAAEDRDQLSATFSILATFVGVLLLVSVLAGMISARIWMPLLFSGFSPGTLITSLQLIYIVFPSVLFIGIAGVFTALLNGFHKFALAAAAPALSSLAVIAAATLARGPSAIYSVAIATAIGFFLQFLLLVPVVKSLGVRYRPLLKLQDPSIKKLLRLGWPLFLYLATGNALLFLERHLASQVSTGAVSAVNYATRLFAVPANFLAAPLAIVAYPGFADEATREGYGELRSRLASMLRMVIFLFLPITVWFVLNALPITSLLYERGQFRPQDSLTTSRVLMFYSVGILPYAIGVILLRCFYAVQDTITPFLAEAASLGLYAVAATWLTTRFGIAGLALTRGLTFYLVTMILIAVLWRKRKLLMLDLPLLSFVLKIAVATLAMALASWTVLQVARAAFDAGGTPVRALIMVGLISVSGGVFLTASYLLKLSEGRQLLTTARDLIPTKVGLRMFDR